jgi:tetratricopeptide (TPR) repeat protein
MPKDLEFIQRGKVLIVRRQFQEAVRVCRLGLLANPSLVEGRLVLGMALMALGRYDDVLAEMRVALEVEANNVLATLLKGEALFYKGDHEQAKEVLERAQKLDPKNDKPEKLLREIRLAREAGLMPDSSREVTDTKVYPAIADGGPVTDAGPADLPDAIPPPPKPDSAAIELISKDLEYDEQTEVDPSPAGAMAGTADAPALAEALSAKIKPTVVHPQKKEEPEEEERTTMPWVGSDEDSEVSTGGETPPISGEPTPVRPAPVIPAAARPTPKPTLLGIPAPTIPIQPTKKRPGLSGDGFEDTGQGDDYADVSSIPSLPRLPGTTTSETGSVSVSSTATTDSMGPGSRSLTLDENTEPTRPESPGSIALGGPSLSPPRLPVRPPSVPVVPALPMQFVPEDSRPEFEDESTAPRPPEFVLPTPEVPQLTMRVESTVGPAPRPPSVPVPRPPSGSQRSVQGQVRKSERWRPTFEVPRPRTPQQWRWLLVGAAGVLVISLAAGLGIRAWRGHAEAARRRDLASKQMATGNLPGFLAAERAYEQVLAAYPDDAEALAGRALIRAGSLYEFDEAERDVRGAIDAARKRQNARSEALVAAADVYLLLANGDAEAAEKSAREAATRHEDDALLAYLVGRAQLLRGDARAASDSFRTALKRDPHNIFALYGLGLAEAGMGEAQGALSAYDRALYENAGHIATIIAKAWLRVQRGRDLLDAETDLVAVAEKFRGQASRAQVAWAELALAELYAQKGDVNRARAALDEARSSGPERSSTFWEEAARAALKSYDVAGAKKDAQRAISLAGASPGPHLALAAALLEEGNAEAALSELAGTAARETPDVLVLRARARLALGRIEAARQDLDQAAAKAPDLPEVALTRARVDLADHNPARAIQTLRRLADQLPGRADVMEVLGIALSSRGDAGAKNALEKAVALNSHAFAARVELAKLLKKEGKPSDAATRLEEAISVHVDPAAERELADLLYDAGDLLGAQKAMDVVLGGTGQPDAATLLLAGRIAAASGEPSASERLLSQALSKGAKASRVNKARANAHLTAGKYKEAVGPALQAVLANSDDSEARSLYIQALSGAGRPTRARLFLKDSAKRLGYRFDLVYALAQIGVREERPDVRLLERVARAAKVARKSPRVVADVLQLLGSAYYQQGEAGHAGAAFSMSLQTNKHNARANYFEGLMLSDSGQIDEARKAFERATNCRPRVPPAFFYLGNLRQKAGDKAGARKAYDEYLALDPDGDYAEDARKELAQLGPS